MHSVPKKETGLNSPTPAEKNLAQKLNLSLVALFYGLMQMGMGLEIEEQSQDNLYQLDQALLETSAILFIYHSQLTDALVLPITLRKELGNLEKILGPVAITHYQGWQKLYLDLVGQLTGSVPLPVVRKKDEPNYTEAEKSRLLRQLIATTNHYLNQPGNLYGVAPMGTRATTLRSDQVNSGFAKLAQSKQLPAIPMAVTHENGQTQVKAGELITPPHPDLPLAEVTNFYMSQLAQLLPIELRGDYN